MHKGYIEPTKRMLKNKLFSNHEDTFECYKLPNRNYKIQISYKRTRNTSKQNELLNWITANRNIFHHDLLIQ